jgi:hypothetical protein
MVFFLFYGFLMGIFPVLRPLSQRAQGREQPSVDANGNWDASEFLRSARMAGGCAIAAFTRANEDPPPRLRFNVRLICPKSGVLPALVSFSMIAEGGDRDKFSPCNGKTGDGVLFRL